MILSISQWYTIKTNIVNKILRHKIRGKGQNGGSHLNYDRSMKINCKGQSDIAKLMNIHIPPLILPPKAIT